MSELPKFRRIEDIQRYLDDMSHDIEVSRKLTDQHQKLLSSAAVLRPTAKLRQVLGSTFTRALIEFDVTPGGAPARKPRGAADKSVVAPQIKKVVIPKLAELAKQYALLEELHQQRVTLDSIETQLSMQFGEKRRGPAYEKAEGAVNALRAKVDEQLEKVLSFLREVAAKHLPKEFTAYVDAVVEAIEARVVFEGSERFVYVSVRDKALLFTEYVVLANAVNEDDQVAPHLYIVIQWQVGRTVEVFVEHEFTPPNSLDGGSEATTANQAMEAISHLLSIEGFSLALGKAPLSLNMTVNPNKLTPDMFQARNYISKLELSEEGDEIRFVFKRGLTEEASKQVGYQIFQDFKALMRNRKIKMRMKTTKKDVTLFIINPAQAQEVSTTDVEFLRERFGLSDTGVRKIAEIINREKK